MSCIYGLTLRGIDALPVEVEVCLTGGLFSISIVGLADTAIKESRERVRISLGTLGIKLKGHISVNLAPADLPKEGALLDLPIAVGIAKEVGFIPGRRQWNFHGRVGFRRKVAQGKGRRACGLFGQAVRASPFRTPWKCCGCFDGARG